MYLDMVDARLFVLKTLLILLIHTQKCSYEAFNWRRKSLFFDSNGQRTVNH